MDRHKLRMKVFLLMIHLNGIENVKVLNLVLKVSQISCKAFILSYEGYNK